MRGLVSPHQNCMNVSVLDNWSLVMGVSDASVKFLIMLQIAPVYSKFDIVEKLTKDYAAPPESPLLMPPHLYLVIAPGIHLSLLTDYL